MWLGFEQKEAGVRQEKCDEEGVGKGPRAPSKRKEREDEVTDITVSPESQRLQKMKSDLERLMEIRREEKRLREKYKV